jgi:Spy/CpxP family protein refolding chaperone
MKKSLIVIAIALNLGAINVATALANADMPERSERKQQGNKHHPMQAFRGLSLTEQQKQDIRALFKQTRQDNSLFRGEAEESREQYQYLMQLPTWDQALAEQLVSERIENSTVVKLNMAKAKHAAYALLNDEQKLLLEERQAKRQNGELKKKNKHKSSKKVKAKQFARLSKHLSLNEEQIEQWKAITVNARSESKALKENSENYRALEKPLLQAESFDEDAWLELHAQASEQRQAHYLIKLKARYDRLATLTDEQIAKFQSMQKKLKNKMKEKGRRSGSI